TSQPTPSTSLNSLPSADSSIHPSTSSPVIVPAIVAATVIPSCVCVLGVFWFLRRRRQYASKKNLDNVQMDAHKDRSESFVEEGDETHPEPVTLVLPIPWPPQPGEFADVIKYNDPMRNTEEDVLTSNGVTDGLFDEMVIGVTSTSEEKEGSMAAYFNTNHDNQDSGSVLESESSFNNGQEQVQSQSDSNVRQLSNLDLGYPKVEARCLQKFGSCLSWSKAQVLEWAFAKGLDKTVIALFAQFNVDGTVLYSFTRDAFVLKEDMGIDNVLILAEILQSVETLQWVEAEMVRALAHHDNALPPSYE
ncbi:hypothetical protein HDU76_011839, partial [Blyttiomyces sp. JEL0837]